MKYGKQPSELLGEILDRVQEDSEEREKMALAEDYYDGEQLSQEVKKRRQDIDLPHPTVNLLAEAIDSVSGQEVKKRTDTHVVGNTANDNELAQATSFMLHQDEERNDVQIVDSKAYRGAITAGVSWVYVGPSGNPMKPGAKVMNVRREDVIDDRSGEAQDGSDRQWVCWRKFMYPDEANMMLPKHKTLIDMVAAGNFDGTPFGGSWVKSQTSVNDGNRDNFVRTRAGKYGIKTTKIALYCVWHRSYEMRTTLTEGDDVQIYDPENIRHVTVANGLDAVVKREHVPIMKESWFVGPYLAIEGDSPHPHNEFPLIECRGKATHKTKRRHGLIEHAFGPQDEYNLHCLKIAEALVSRTIMWEEGAFGIGPDALTKEQLRDEVSRRDTLLEVRGQAHNLNSVSITREWDQVSNLVSLRDQSRDQVRIALGVNFALTGEGQENVSGVAAQTLAELSAATLGTINSNYASYRKQRAFLQLAWLTHKAGKREMRVEVEGDMGQQAKEIILNHRQPDGKINNRMSLLKMQIKLKPVSSSEGYKEFNFNRLTELHNNTQDPTLQQALTPAIIKMSDAPDAEQILEDWNAARGQSSDPEAQEAQQEQQALQKRVQQLEIEEREAKIKLDLAKAAEAQSKAELNGAEASAPEAEPAAEGVDSDVEARKAAKIRQLRSIVAARQLRGTPRPGGQPLPAPTVQTPQTIQ